LRLAPNLPEAHLVVAERLIEEDEDYERARDEIAKAEGTSPNNPYVFWFRASIDSRQGRWEESAKNLERAATLEPRSPQLLLDLAQSYLALRRFRLAEQTYDRIIGLKPDDPSLKIYKAYLFTFGEIRSEFTAARDQLNRKVEESPDEPDLLSALRHS
jgi:tetratricopeptide (TPR) repeat protein